MPTVPEEKEDFPSECVRNIVDNELAVNQDGRLCFYCAKTGSFQRTATPAQEESAIFSLFSKEEQVYLTRQKVQSIQYKLKNLTSVKVATDYFCRDGRYVKALNGIVDTKKLKLYHGDKRLRFDYCINAKFLEEEQIETPHLEQFLRTSLEQDKKKRRLFLEALGFLVSPSASAKKAVMFVGARHSGKSTISGLIRHLVGADRTSSVPLHELDARFTNSALDGALVNIHAEMDSRPLSSIAAFKAITGGDTVKVEGKGTSLRNLRYRTKLFFAGNSLPGLKNAADIELFLNRIVLLNFNRSITESKWDTKLGTKLVKEADKIFTLSMRAYSNLRSNDFRFTEPDTSRQLLAAYRSESNTVASFMEDCCRVDAGLRQHSAVLYLAYTKYCAENLLQAVTSTSFSKQLGVLLEKPAATIRVDGTDKPLKGFKGIDLRRPLHVTGQEKSRSYV